MFHHFFLYRFSSKGLVSVASQSRPFASLELKLPSNTFRCTYCFGPYVTKASWSVTVRKRKIWSLFFFHFMTSFNKHKSTQQSRFADINRYLVWQWYKMSPFGLSFNSFITRSLVTRPRRCHLTSSKLTSTLPSLSLNSTSLKIALEGTVLCNMTWKITLSRQSLEQVYHNRRYCLRLILHLLIASVTVATRKHAK